MHYGHPPHATSTEDLTVLRCANCGWHSEEMTREQVSAIGIPWSCHGTCGKSGVHYVRFHPSERTEAYKLLKGSN